MPVAVENRAALDAISSYRVCAVSFNKALQRACRSLRSLWRPQLNAGTLARPQWRPRPSTAISLCLIRRLRRLTLPRWPDEDHARTRLTTNVAVVTSTRHPDLLLRLAMAWGSESFCGDLHVVTPRVTIPQ
jgi:hypothetical protein